IAVLNAGIIQQLGTPQELYATPANLFVAGFIGSPAMDFFTARLVRTDWGSAVVVIGNGAEASTLTPVGRVADIVTRHATAEGRPVIVGIRPEDLHLVNGSQSNTLLGIAEFVEHLGSEQLLYLRVPGQTVPNSADTQSSTARLPVTAHVRAGETIALAVDGTRLHLFDPTTTNRFA
ncbi:MAG: TOBE domain-containing protein, partial [Ktedonobacterales bacterium]